MSVLVNGCEDGTGQNLTPAATYALFNTYMQKVAQMNLVDKDVPFFGLVKDGQIRGTSQIAIQRTVTAVEIRCEGSAPSTNPLTCQLVVNGVAASQVYSLPAGQAHVLIGVINDGNGGGSGSGLIVPPNQTLGVQIINGNLASDVVVCPKVQLVIL